MIVCFLGVIGLTLGGSLHDSALDNMQTFGWFVAGIIFLFLSSWTQAGLFITSRGLIGVHFSVVILYISFACFAFALFLMELRYLNKGTFYLFSSTDSLPYLALGAFFDAVVAISVTIAY